MDMRKKIGAPGKIRTHDPQVRSLVLYPTELRALQRIAVWCILANLLQTIELQLFSCLGGQLLVGTSCYAEEISACSL